MMNNTGYFALTIIVVGLTTWLTRAIPYLLFGGEKELPKTVGYLGNVLPASIMIILVLYCIRGIDFSTFPFGLAEVISIGVVILFQIIKKDSILSMVVGTACYMILIRVS